MDAVQSVKISPEWCLHLYPALKMRAVPVFKLSHSFYLTVRRHIAKDRKFFIHRHEKMKVYQTDYLINKLHFRPIV